MSKDFQTYHALRGNSAEFSPLLPRTDMAEIEMLRNAQGTGEGLLDEYGTAGDSEFDETLSELGYTGLSSEPS